jgi:hypothetical protein
MLAARIQELSAECRIGDSFVHPRANRVQAECYPEKESRCFCLPTSAAPEPC